MIFAQVEVMKKLLNEVHIDNIIDSFNEEFNLEKLFVMIQTFKATRRRELKAQDKIKRKDKRLSIRKFMHIEITIDEHITMTLLNFDNEVNIISTHLIKKMKLNQDEKNSIVLSIISDKRLRTHEMHFLDMQVVDCKSHTRYFEEFFLIVDITHESLVLDMSWLKLANSNIRWSKKQIQWRFEAKVLLVTSRRLHEIEIKKLVMKINRKSSTIFCLYIKSIIKIDTKYMHFDRHAMIVSIVVDEFTKKMLEAWKFYEHAFSKKQAHALSKRTFYDHVINLKKDKQVSWDSIYSLTKIELAILRNYLEKNLVNEFIQRSQSFVDASIIFVKKKNDSLRLCVNYRALNEIIVKNKYSLSLIDESLDRLSKTQVYT